jgi:glycosyltransferase involved in cell wall biosynthesis
MKIWINNPFDFLPGEGARLQRYGLLAQALVKAGHQVVWWSSDWNHLEKARREVLKCEPASLGATPSQGSSKVLKLGMQIRLIKTLPYFKNIGLRRLISHWLYARSWARECAREHQKPDLIICSAPPLSTGWVMRSLCRRWGCAGVIDVMDVWPETFERVAPPWVLGPLRWMAKRVYEGADGISAAGDSYLEVVKRYLETPRQGEADPKQTPRQGEADPKQTPRQGEADPKQTPRQGEPPRQGGAHPGEKPMYRCYHGIEMGGGTPRQGEADPRREEKCARADGAFRLVYVGNMGKGYDLVTLVQAVKQMIDEGQAISLDLAGSGEQEESLKVLAQTKQDAIRFHGVITGDALRALLLNADVGVVPLLPKTYVAVPYKLADYTAAGLPMISSLKGETEDLIAKYEAGWFYEAWSVASLKGVLKVCGEVVKEEKIRFYRRNALRMAEECFDADKIYPEFVTWLELRAKRR